MPYTGTCKDVEPPEVGDNSLVDSERLPSIAICPSPNKAEVYTGICGTEEFIAADSMGIHETDIWRELETMSVRPWAEYFGRGESVSFFLIV